MPGIGLRLVRFVLVAAIAGACAGSPATRFYLLSNVAGGPLAGSAEARAPFVVVIGPVSLPGYLDRRQIVTRQGAHAIQVATFDQWAGSLDDMIAGVLVEAVAALLPRDRVLPFQSVSRPDLDYRVAIDVSRFDVDDAGEAVLLAGWQIYGRDGRASVHVGETTARAQAASDGFDDRVAAMSRALGDLGAEIARAVLQLEASAGG